MKKSKLITLIVLITIFPSNVFANVATPIMLAAGFHLILGNAIIGTIEGLILSKLFNLKKSKTIIILITANYFSTWIGILSLAYLDYNFIPLNLYNAWSFFWIMVVIAYIATLILEWPFVFFCLSKTKNKIKKSIYGILVINSITYVLLFGWYWIISPPTLYTKMKIVPISEISLPENITLYFIKDEDGDVYSRNFSTKKITHIFPLKSKHNRDRLGVKPSTNNSNKWDLFAKTYHYRDKTVEISNEFATIAAPFTKYRKEKNYNVGNTALLGSATNSNWKCHSYSDFIMQAPLTLINKKANKKIKLKYETLFCNWEFRNVTHLPEDKIIFHLGIHQICILDINNKKIALLEYGRGPIAVINEKE